MTQLMMDESTLYDSMIVNGLSNETQDGLDENSSILASFSWSPMEWSWSVILQLISAILGIVGNILVIVVLFHRRKRNRSTDSLISGLAVADCLTSVMLIPNPSPTYIPNTWLGELYCRFVITQSLLWASITASAYLLISISVERYIAVVYPLHFKRLITRRRISNLICLIWILSVLSVLFVFFVHSVDGFTNKCKEQYLNRYTKLIIAYYWFCLRIVVPCFAMLITQVLIARKLSQQSNNAQGMTTHLSNRNPMPSFHIVARERILKMMIIVILIYFICWIPNQIAYLGYNIGWVPESYINSDLHSMLTVLGFYNSCANPIIYAVRYPEFKEALKDMVTRNSERNNALGRGVIEIRTICGTKMASKP
ncbi:beta-1 adrenergic receptor-like [Lytechinus pictus]|uniref:beta-1 adrenergic receptor-like n=1 Tax=Lytechinus pictus TaxID=7653 RepID=UPI0030B9FB8D